MLCAFLRDPSSFPNAKYAFLRNFNFTVVQYMDDLLFVSYMSYSKTCHLVKLLLQLFLDFGITISKDKSVLTPCRTLVFLGYYVSVDGTVSLTEKRYAKLMVHTK